MTTFNPFGGGNRTGTQFASDIDLFTRVEDVNVVATSSTAQTLPNTAAGGAMMSDITLTANCTITPATAARGKRHTVLLRQDSTGSRIPTFTGVKWPMNTTPVWSTAAGAIDIVDLFCIDGSSWMGSALRNMGNAAPAISFGIGANNWGYTDLAPANDAQILGAKHQRYEVGLSDSVATLTPIFDKCFARGVTPLLLAGDDLPTNTAAANVALWAAAFGTGGTYWSGKTNPLPLKWIEMGNETFYSYKSLGTMASRGTSYANSFAAAYAAIQASTTAAKTVGLLCMADGNDVAAINAMFTAQPTLATKVAGWTIHPYAPLVGPVDASGSVAWPSDRLFPSLIAQAQTWLSGNGVTVGPSSPLFLTEYGISSDDGIQLTDNYGWPRAMTYAQAGAGITSIANYIQTNLPGIVRMVMIYTARDGAAHAATTDRESYFGGLQLNAFNQAGGTTKGAMTSAIQAVMARGT